MLPMIILHLLLVNQETTVSSKWMECSGHSSLAFARIRRNRNLVLSLKICYNEAMKRVAIVFLLAFLLATSIVRNTLWQNDGDLWEDIILKSPRKARAYNEYGLHVMTAGDPGKALALFKRSIEIDQYQPVIYVNIGLAFEKVNQIDNAITAYRQAISNQPDDPTAYYNLGVLYFSRFQDRRTALSYFIKARDLNPQEPDVHEYLGRIYADMGDLVRSREELALNQYLKQ